MVTGVVMHVLTRSSYGSTLTEIEVTEGYGNFSNSANIDRP